MEKKEEKQTRYPWHLAPEWANFAATDWTGRRVWYEFEPYCFAISWDCIEGRWAEIFDPCSDFKQSLESRPT